MSEKTGASARRRDPMPDQTANRQASVQPHACVLAVGERWTIRAVSDNSFDFLGRAPQDLLGQTLEAVLPEDVAHGLRARGQGLSASDPVARLMSCSGIAGGRTFDVTATRVGADVYFEFEAPPGGPGLLADPEQIRRLARKSADKDTLTGAAEEAARTLAALTGFARVSVHGIGKSGIGPAVGLYATPPLVASPNRAILEAHEAAFGAHLHVIPDVSELGICRLVSTRGMVPPTRAEIRALGSAGIVEELVHALRGGKIRAAMTIPVRVGGELWGVILCHSDLPIRPAVGDRGALSLFADLFGYEIGRLEQRLVDRAQTRGLELRQTISAEVEAGADLPTALRAAGEELATLIPHDGWMLWHQGNFHSSGHSVTQPEFETVFAELHRLQLRDSVAFDQLAELMAAKSGLDPRLTAVMVIPLSRSDSEYLLLFRRLSAEGDRVRTWESWESAAGRTLRAALVEAQLQLVQTTRDTRLHRHARQGLLMSELTHRTRNILNLIQGLVAQGAGEAGSVEEYAQVLEARIHAVARAYDDLAEQDWGRVGLRVLLERELNTALTTPPGQGPLARMSGEQIDLSPTAFTTMALVLHELVRNAREHGALSREEGRVDIEMSLGENGLARIVWRESGGPAARRPAQRGFGLKVIEESVPHELRGTADLEFGRDGFVARFAIPPGHFTRLRPEAEPVEARTNEFDPRPDEIAIDGAALILDDSLIIAIESEDLLRAAGASEVYACNSVDSALEVLDRGDVTFALLDVNLGSETSLAVAEQLWVDGIPAVLATGYGANEDLLADFPPLPVLSKPYTVAEIKDVLRHFSRRERR